MYDSKHIYLNCFIVVHILYIKILYLAQVNHNVLLQSRGYRELAVYAVVVWMVSGDSWQTSDARFWSLLASKDSTEAQWSALSHHSRKSAEFGSWPFVCGVFSVVSASFFLGLNSILVYSKKYRSTPIIALDHDFSLRNTVGPQQNFCVWIRHIRFNWNKLQNIQKSINQNTFLILFWWSEILNEHLC